MWRTEKTETGSDQVWDGVELGIAPSPYQGTANIQNANISTEQGEVMASFGRRNQAQAAIIGGTLTPDGTALLNAPANLKAGTWIRVTASTVSGITAGVSPVPSVATLNYLVVGGGGAGGSANNSAGGGGGAGGFIEDSDDFTIGKYKVVVGAGGIAATIQAVVPASANGGNSQFATEIAIGGGGGGLGDGGASGSSKTPNTGGSGGGAGVDSGAGTTGAAGTAGQGFAGGNSFHSATVANRAGGGGGGADGVGTNGVSAVGGAGGAAKSSSITGVATLYAGGGGGGSFGTPGAGGGGGATAGQAGSNSPPNATANTGSGGGGNSINSASFRPGSNGGSGIVVISYPTGTVTAIGGDISYVGGNTIHQFKSVGEDVFEILAINGGGLYYVSSSVGGKVKLSELFDPYAANTITHGDTGSITFDTVATPGPAIAKATERYGNINSSENRYYILDESGYLWVFDSAVFKTNGTEWMLPDPSNYSLVRFTGMNVINGWVFCLNNQRMFVKPTVNLGTGYSSASNAFLANPFYTHTNYVYVGKQGKLYYTDLNYIGEIFPTNSFLTGLANIQSYGSYTADTTTGTLTNLLNGSTPYTQDANGDTARIPAVFFTDVYGAQPTNLIPNKIYWIEYNNIQSTFQVFANQTGGSAINIATGATGNQYFNTLGMLGEAGINGEKQTVQFTQQRVNLPYDEVAQSMVEVGNQVIIGGKSNILYPWNQVDATPSDFIILPESDVRAMINVNNMGYVFAGNKGNIYVTNGAVASLALKVPDYCAGIAGDHLSYIEPKFTWYDAMFLRGRVYFSILDQTDVKAGNCGGVWSFIPTGNLASTDVGMSLRLENQNSYGTYNGMARILIPNANQDAIAPQYWAAWQSLNNKNTAAFGIDYTATSPVTSYVVETDVLATGTMLGKKTFEQIEFKLSTPLRSTDAVELFYRNNTTDAWTTCGDLRIEPNNRISGYYNAEFQKTQWVQFRAVITTTGTTASSFVRLKQIRLR